jgi:hypothetical protein
MAWCRITGPVLFENAVCFEEYVEQILCSFVEWLADEWHYLMCSYDRTALLWMQQGNVWMFVGIVGAEHMFHRQDSTATDTARECFDVCRDCLGRTCVPQTRLHCYWSVRECVDACKELLAEGYVFPWQDCTAADTARECVDICRELLGAK